MNIQLFIISTIVVFNSVKAQEDTINSNRLKTVIGVEATIYTGTMIGLNQMWYQQTPRSNFHLFNDGKQWLFMDKIGHATTAYQVGRVGFNSLKWTGLNDSKSIWYGGLLGTFFLTTVEVFDGYSKDWGFSVTDMVANIAGSGFFIGQQSYWKEQRISLKYSFLSSEYASIRPNTLGKNTIEQSLKDYNGQTYWLSFNISSFLNNENLFPKWINFAVGYGADGLIGGEKNSFWSKNKYYDYTHIPRNKQLYFSMDIDLTRIKTKNQFLSVLLNTFGFVKIPFPALMIEESKGVKFIPLQ